MDRCSLGCIQSDVSSLTTKCRRGRTVAPEGGRTQWPLKGRRVVPEGGAEWTQKRPTVAPKSGHKGAPKGVNIGA